MSTCQETTAHAFQPVCCIYSPASIPSFSARSGIIASSHPPSPLPCPGPAGPASPTSSPRRTAARDFRERHRTQPALKRQAARSALHYRPLFQTETSTGRRKQKLDEVTSCGESTKSPQPPAAREGADPASHPTSQARPGFQYPEPTPRSSPCPLPDSTPKNKKDLQSAGGGASPNIATQRIERLAVSQSCSASAGICQGRQQARQGTARWRSKHTTHDTRC